MIVAAAIVNDFEYGPVRGQIAKHPPIVFSSTRIRYQRPGSSASGSSLLADRPVTANDQFSHGASEYLDRLFERLRIENRSAAILLPLIVSQIRPGRIGAPFAGKET